MSKTDFLPKRDSDLDIFEGNFIEKLGTHSTALGLDPAIVSALIEKINSHRLAYASMVSKRAQSRSERQGAWNS